MTRYAVKRLIRNYLYRKVNYSDIKKKCKFCAGAQFHLFDHKFLHNYLNSMYGLNTRMKNRICSKCQRKLKKVIVYARELHIIDNINLNIVNNTQTNN